MKQYKQLTDITLEDVATTENPYAPYKRPSEVSAVLAAIMTKVHTIATDMELMVLMIKSMQSRMDELEKRNGTTNQ